jgi:hypothetical protein
MKRKKLKENKTVKRVKHYFWATSTFVLCAAVIAFSIPQNGHGNPAVGEKDVRVVNLPTEAVPVAVQGAPTIKAQQNGAWNVSISGTPTVQIGNGVGSPVQVRDVDRPTAQPFQKNVDIALAPGENSKAVAVSVPAGKIFVIEQISGFGNGVPGEQVDFSIMTRVPGDATYQFHYLLTTRDAEQFPGNVLYRLNEKVRVYSGDVPFPLMRVDRFPANASISFKFTVAGYLVNP